MLEIKCVVVGDQYGHDHIPTKTVMLITYTEKRYPIEYVPTVMDNFEATLIIDGEELKYSLWDTSGQEGYARARTLAYPKTDVVILVFSIATPASYENIRAIWAPDIQRHLPGVPYLLVGAQSELRDEQEVIACLAEKKLMPISFEQGQQLAKEIGALKYMECSALSRKGLEEIFDDAIKAALRKYSPPVLCENAIQEKNNVRLQKLLRKHSINSSQTLSELLLLAIEKGNIQIVTTLLNEGADIHYVGSRKETILYLAVKYQGSNLYDFLIKKGAAVKGEIHFAAKEGNNEIIKFLLRKRIPIECQDPEGRTPLHIAALNGQYQTVELLIQKGAKINIADNQQHTALQLAAKAGHVKAARILLRNGAEVSHESSLNEKLNTFIESCLQSLPVAIKLAKEKNIELLFQLTADCQPVDEDYGYTALHVAALAGEDSLIAPLIARGVPLEKKDKEGKTALQLAEQQKYKAFVQRFKFLKDEHHLEQLVKEAASAQKTIQDFASRREQLRNDINQLLNKNKNDLAAFVQKTWNIIFQLRAFQEQLRNCAPLFDPFGKIFPLLFLRRENFSSLEKLQLTLKKRDKLTPEHPIFKDILKQKLSLEKIYKELLKIDTLHGLLAALKAFIQCHDEAIAFMVSATQEVRDFINESFVIISGANLAPCFLKINAGARLTPPLGQKDNIHGTACVYAVGGIHFKQDPHAPGVEFMVSSLGDLLAGQGATPTELVKVIGADGAPRTYLASKTVKGKELQYVIQNHPKFIEKIRLANFSAMVVLGLLTDPQDGKPDNYMVEFAVNAQKEIEWLEILGIDNDIAFAEPVVLSHKRGNSLEQRFVNIMNVLYFFPHMLEPVDKEFKETFLKRVPEFLLLDWLQKLHVKNQEYQALLDQGIFTEKEFTQGGRCNLGLQLPIKLQPGTIKRLYGKLLMIRELLQNSASVTHQDLFFALEPAIAKHYVEVQTQCQGNIMDCIVALYKESIPDVEALREFAEQIKQGQTQHMTLQVLKTAEERGFEKNRNQNIPQSMLELLSLIDYKHFVGEAAKPLCEIIVQASQVLFPNKYILHIAVETNNYELAERLLQHQLVDINRANEQGYTGLHIAASIGNYAIVALLLNNKARFDLKDKLQETALDKAKKKQHQAVMECIETYIKTGVAPKQPDTMSNYSPTSNSWKYPERPAAPPISPALSNQLAPPVAKEALFPSLHATFKAAKAPPKVSSQETILQPSASP